MTVSKHRWVAPAVILGFLALLAAAWQWTPLKEWAHPDRWAPWVEPYRYSPLAFPATLIVFVVAELFMFPVLVLVFLCGLVFGPWLGAAYALSGCLASGMVTYAIGRRLGRRRLEHWGGKLVRTISRIVDRRGIIAVFLVRKIPAPYTLVNLVIGASSISFRDFVIGTFLGMGVGVVLIVILGSQLVTILRQPDLGSIALALVVIAGPLAIALILQRYMNRRAEEAR